MKKGKGLVIVIVILSILLLSAIGYILYDKDVFNLKDKDINNTEQVKLTEEEINKLHDSLIFEDVDLYNETDKNKLVTIDNIGSDKLYYYALMKYVEDNNIIVDDEKLVIECLDEEGDVEDDLKFCKTGDEGGFDIEVSLDQVVSISNVDLQKEIEELFDPDKIYEFEDKKVFDGLETYFGFLYSKVNDKFYAISTASGKYPKYIVGNSMIKYEQKDDTIIFYDKVARCLGTFCYKSGNRAENGTPVVASVSGIEKELAISDYPNLKIDEKIVKSNKDNSEIDFDYIFKNYSDLLYTYKTTFKKHDNGKYYWYSSEIVNS